MTHLRIVGLKRPIYSTCCNGYNTMRYSEAYDHCKEMGHDRVKPYNVSQNLDRNIVIVCVYGIPVN